MHGHGPAPHGFGPPHGPPPHGPPPHGYGPPHHGPHGYTNGYGYGPHSEPVLCCCKIF